jgi:DNA-binding GntR family transcriptional regulator
LAAEGLVTIIPNRGATVTERSIEELEELQFIRRMLEGAAARRGPSFSNVMADAAQRSAIRMALRCAAFTPLYIAHFHSRR